MSESDEAQALRAAAKDARGMHDPPAPDCAEWADWLDARADRLAAKGHSFAVAVDQTRVTDHVAEHSIRCLAERRSEPPVYCEELLANHDPNWHHSHGTGLTPVRWPTERTTP